MKKGAPENKMAKSTVEMILHRVVNANIKPDGTVWVDIDVTIGSKRQVLHFERRVELPEEPGARQEKVDALGRQIKSFTEPWRERE